MKILIEQNLMPNSFILNQEKMADLLRAIQDLFEYGLQITDYDDDENTREGLIAMGIAQQLKAEIKKLTDPNSSVAEQQQCKKNFTHILQQGDNDLAAFRPNWKSLTELVRTKSLLDLIIHFAEMIFSTRPFYEKVENYQRVTSIQHKFNALQDSVGTGSTPESQKQKEMKRDLKQIRDPQPDVSPKNNI